MQTIRNTSLPVPSYPAAATTISHIAVSSPETPETAPAFTSVGVGPMVSTMPLGNLIGPSAGAGRIVVPVPHAATAGRVRISSGVSAGLLINPIQAVFPPLARITHTEGTVVVQAIISKSGSIEAAHVLSGPAMLQSAALAAVEQARYHPFLLNGEPTEVDTTISIVFHIGN